jgi:hypothetical protein
MPRYTDPETGKSISSDTPLTKAEIAQAFNIASPAPEPPETQVPSTRYSEIPRGVGENLVSMATGLASLPFMVPHMIKSTYEKYAPPIEPSSYEKYASSVEPSPEGWTEKLAKIGQAIAPEPVTPTGQRAYELMGIPFRYLGKAAETVGRFAENVTGSPIVATGADIGVQALPFLFPYGRKAIEKFNIPERLYTSAIKPGIRQKLSVGKRESAMRAGVEEGILPTMGGLDKLATKIDSIENQIDSIIKQGKVTAKPIKTLDIADSLDSLIDMYNRSGMPPETYASINDVRNKVLSQGNYMSAEEAQAFKQNTYKLIRKSYGELSSAVNEAQKTVARAVKDEIAKQYPEISTLNEKVGPMLQLEDEIQRAVKRIQNRDLIGIGIPLKTMAGKALKVAGGAGAGYAAGGPATGAIAGLVIGILDSPKVKSALAIALDRASKMLPPVEKGLMAGTIIGVPQKGKELIQAQEAISKGTTRGLLSKPQEKETVTPPVNVDKELIQAQDAISRGASPDKVKQMFKQRTGEEWPAR